MPRRVSRRVEGPELQAADLDHLFILDVTVDSRDLSEPEPHHHRLGGELPEHRFGLGVHQDLTTVLVYEGGDGPDVVYVGVGDEDLAYLEVGLLDSERDASCLVAGVDDGARAGLLVSDDVAVLLKGSDGEHLEDHRISPLARPIKNSTRRRAGVPVAPLGA